jgi:FkbM family methyltransferase
MQKDEFHEGSQFGEDELILDMLGSAPGLVFVEVGAFQPKALSQSWRLEQAGWDGVLIEPQPDLCRELRGDRRATVIQAACVGPDQAGKPAYLVLQGALSKLTAEVDDKANIIEIPTTTLNDILSKLKIGRVDFLSIDTEGSELDVLSGFDIKSYSPRLISIEDHFENSMKHSWLVRRGYRLIERYGCNNWYIPAHTGFNTPLRRRVYLMLKVIQGHVRSLLVSARFPIKEGSVSN